MLMSDAHSLRSHDPLVFRAHLSELGRRPFDIAVQLAGAAHSNRDGIFDVTVEEIVEKLSTAKSLSFATQDRGVVGFMALYPAIRLARTQLSLAYVQGVIVHATQRGKNLPFELLKAGLGPHGWPDLIALHTQTPTMARCVERWGHGLCFPRTMGPHAMNSTLVEDLAEGMVSIGRSSGDPETGICRDAYPRRLFRSDVDQIENLGPRDSLFMVTFTSAASAKALVPRERAA